MSITSFDDFCLWMYCLIDDGWKTIAHHFQRPGPKPTSCSDSELLTVAIVSECCGWDVERDLPSRWQAHRDLFPHLPSPSRFNRRRRALQQAFDLLRQWALTQLDLAADPQCILDSVPIEVVEFHHAPRASRQWAVYGASFGKVSAKQRTIYGYKLHVLMTVSGVLLDWSLTGAHERDLPAGTDLLQAYSQRVVIADKAYISSAVSADLLSQRQLRLLTWPRRNQRQQLPQRLYKPFQDLRRRIETVNSQLCEQFALERNHALSFFGLVTRLATKLAAHVLCVLLNRLLDHPDCLHIKQLAFPI
jgi:hypothetical protein